MILYQHLLCRTTKPIIFSRLHEIKRFSSYYTFPLFTGTQQLLEASHFYSNLPWWTTIAISTVLLRCITTVPMGIKQNRIAAKMELLQPQLKNLGDSVRSSLFSKNLNEADKKRMQQDFRKEIAKRTSEIYKKNDISLMQFIMLPWIQMPTWITLSLALRNISGCRLQNETIDVIYMPSEGITTEGLLWFQDLSVPDPFYIIPFIILFVNIANIEINTMRAQGFWKYLKPILRLVAVLTAFISSQVPSAMSFYWCTSSICGLIQNVILKIPSVRRKLDIPKTNSEQERSIRNILGFKEKLGE
uniref:Mitochondrial inner membrane protein COX18 n=1 Tax=Hydra vulgaris TaxID=6087 RepID=T2M9V7_HYDVU